MEPERHSFRTIGFTSADGRLADLAGLARPVKRPASQGGQGVITHAPTMTAKLGDPQSVHLPRFALPIQETEIRRTSHPWEHVRLKAAWSTSRT